MWPFAAAHRRRRARVPLPRRLLLPPAESLALHLDSFIHFDKLEEKSGVLSDFLARECVEVQEYVKVATGIHSANTVRLQELQGLLSEHQLTLFVLVGSGLRHCLDSSFKTSYELMAEGLHFVKCFASLRLLRLEEE